MKLCSECNQEKELTEFCKSSRSKTGYSLQCKNCINLKAKLYRESIEKDFKARRKKYYQKNVDKMRAEKIEYGKKHKTQKELYDKLYREVNKERIAISKKDWYYKNKDNPILKIKRNLRRRVHYLLKGSKSKHTYELIGCSYEEFKIYIESLFKDGMTWENYGPIWHIDHIKPCSKFDLTKEEEQLKCFNYKNQQPLFAEENLKKSDKYEDSSNVS